MNISIKYFFILKILPADLLITFSRDSMLQIKLNNLLEYTWIYLLGWQLHDAII